MLEALAGHLPYVDDALLNSMRQYQRLMGDIQDGEVLRRGFDKFSRKTNPQKPNYAQLRHELDYSRKKMIDRYQRRAALLLDFWPVGSSPATRRKLQV